MNLSLDMKMIKAVSDTSRYKAIFGRFPMSKMTDDKKLSPEVISDIQKHAKEYNPEKDYIALLNQTSPELAEALQLIDNNVLNKPGTFQFLLKNGRTNHEMMFALDEHYNNVSKAFHNNGAMVSNDEDENSIVRLPNSTPKSQMLILEGTNAQLKQTLSQGVSMVKTYEPTKKLEEKSSEVANVNGTLLIIITIVEVFLITLYIYMMIGR